MVSPLPVSEPAPSSPRQGRPFEGAPPFPAFEPVSAGTASTPLPPWPGSVETIPWPGPKPPLARTMPFPTAERRAPEEGSGFADFTDADLRDALAGLLPPSGAGPASEAFDFEPMIRAAVRRALAEYSPASRPFEAPPAMDRLGWKLRALFTSRTYDEVLFEKTHRFQVDEVFLLDGRSLALVSFASCNPCRHGDARKVGPMVQRIAAGIRDESGHFLQGVDLGSGRHVVPVVGSRLVLAAVVRGLPNELLALDLRYALQRIEVRFGSRLAPGGPPLLRELQPFLEDCLLIQAPAGAA